MHSSPTEEICPSPSSRARDEPVRLALIGYGTGARYYQAPFIEVTPGLDVSAVVTAHPERRAHVAQDWPAARLLASPANVWEEAEHFDAVVISTPNATHERLARAAVCAGLDVVVDKPVTLTAPQAAALQGLGGDSGRLVVPYHSRRWDGDFLAVRAVVEAGAVGSAHRFESRFERWRPEPKSTWSDSPDPALGGGILHGLGVHLVDQALLLFGPVSSVGAEVRALRSGSAEDDVFVSLHHMCGVMTHIWASDVTLEPGPRFRLLGSGGAYVSWEPDSQERALRSGLRPRDGAAWAAALQRDDATLVGADRTVSVPVGPGDAGAFWRSLRAAIVDGSPPPVTLGEAIQGLSVLDAARRSARSGDRQVPVIAGGSVGPQAQEC